MKNYPKSITVKLTPKQLQALEPLKKRFKKLTGDWPVGAIFANVFLFDNVSDAPNGMRYCCHCGKPLQDVPYTEPEESEE